MSKGFNSKKLVIYFVVMGLMLLGTAFLIYENYTLNAGKTSVVAPAPAAIVDSLSVVSIPSLAKDNKINTDLFLDTKYQSLRQLTGSIDKVSPVVGSQNPFTPYK